MTAELIASGVLFAGALLFVYTIALAVLVVGALRWGEPITKTPVPEPEGDAIAELYRRLETDGGER